LIVGGPERGRLKEFSSIFVIYNQEKNMRNIMTVAATVACVFALAACGGGGDGDNGNTLSRADEGIWSNLDSSEANQYGMQVVILSDGSYWGLYGMGGQTENFNPIGVLQGSASVNSGSVSGTYTDFWSAPGLFKATYSGTVSAQNSLNLIFNDPLNRFMGKSLSGGSFNMRYDSNYKQPTSLTVVTGNYQGHDCVINTDKIVTEACGVSTSGPLYTSLTLSGSNLTVGDNEMNGTLAPHGTAVNVFDVSLTASATSDPNVLPAGTVYKGILFQTSSGNTEIIATSGGNSAYYYIGTKQN
jgi:hypothetical protein